MPVDIQEVRENFIADNDAFEPIRKEGAEDMKCIAGDPWDAQERRAREDAHRPCLSLDELNQYCNQVINDVRQNKRAIKIDPDGFGSNEKTAELRQDTTRQIEYKSNAQHAYITAFENVLCRSYGSFRIGTQYESDTSFNQEIIIRRVPNPDSVVWDASSKELDNSDADHCFVLDLIKKSEFKRRFGSKAKIVDFGEQHVTQAGVWLQGENVQVGEYWKVKKRPRKLLALQMTPNGDVKGVFEDELNDKLKPFLVPNREREVQFRTVTQYITNGVEIIEENEWKGKHIPIVTMYGKELYVSDSPAAAARRTLMSLVRLARDPYMLYCYYRTCEAEVVGMTPKTPYIGYEGQFEGHTDEWETIFQVPRAYLQVKPVIDAASGQLLPLPQRQSYEPALQALEMGAEGARRAIQAAMGISALPTAAQRHNEKSGVALDSIRAQEDHGSFHFIDAFDIGLKRGGVIIDDLFPVVYDSDRHIGARNAKDEHRLIRINAKHKDEKTGEEVLHRMDEGKHLVTISTGPSHASQREAVSTFLDAFIANLKALPVPPPVAAKLLSIAIKLKNLGPLGDEMAQLLSPDQGKEMPPQAQAAIQQLQSQLQEAGAELQKLQAEKAGKVVDNEYKMKIAEIDRDVKVLVALVTAKRAQPDQEFEMYKTFMSENHQAAHEAAMQSVQHQHEKDMADKQAQAASAQSAQDAAQKPPETAAA